MISGALFRSCVLTSFRNSTRRKFFGQFAVELSVLHLTTALIHRFARFTALYLSVMRQMQW
jgi:hypothetical protein